jgi:uncharacterized membrane protein
MKVKSEKSYGSKLSTIFVTYGLIWFFTTVLLIQVLKDTISFDAFWLALITFIVFLVILVRAFKKNYEPFKCPDCGQIIEESLENSNTENEAIIYHCKKCDVLWHVGETISG